MEYSERFEADFARRTLDNLSFIRTCSDSAKDNQVYEVTQLINSLMGLIVFPFESSERNIGEYFTENCGNPNEANALLGEFKIYSSQCCVGEPEVTLSFLVHYMRNSLCHAGRGRGRDHGSYIKGLAKRDKTIAGDVGQLHSLEFKNSGYERWERIVVDLDTLKEFVKYFAAEMFEEIDSGNWLE